MTDLDLVCMAIDKKKSEVINTMVNSGLYDREDVYFAEFCDILQFYPSCTLTSIQEFKISVLGEVDDNGDLHYSDCEALFEHFDSDWISWTLSVPYGTKIRNVKVLFEALGI